MSDGEPSPGDGTGTEDEAPKDTEEPDKSLQDEALIQTHNAVLDDWEASVDQATRGAAMDSVIETGNLPEAAGLTEDHVDTLYAGYSHQTAVEVLDQIGITADEWAEHLSEDDMPAFRRAVLTGDWETLRNHAKKAVVMRHETALPLTHKKWAKLQRAG